MSNLDLWDSVYNTNPKHAKDFTRPGGFKGTAIKPLYTVHKATELWGSMGVKWGAESGEPVISGNFIFIKARLWYPSGEGKGWVEHWGGDLLMKNDKPNDEAAKMAFTDAIGKCLVQLGFSADIHMGEFDGNKYVEPEPKTEPIFKNASARNTYIQSVINKIEQSETKKEINGHLTEEKTKITQMKSSDNEHDNLGAEEIEKRYRAKFKLINDAENEERLKQDFEQRK